MISLLVCIDFEGSDIEKTTKSSDLSNTTLSEVQVLTDIEGMTKEIKEEDPKVEKVELLIPWRDEHFQTYTRYDGETVIQ